MKTADFTAKGFRSAEDFRATVAGASDLEGDIAAGNVAFDISGASRLLMKGLAKNVTLKASGASIAARE